MKNHLHRWVIEALSFMALGLFGSLIIGLILETIGNQTLIPQIDLSFLSEIGKVAMSVTGAAIGVAIAYGLGAKPLVIFFVCYRWHTRLYDVWRRCSWCLYCYTHRRRIK